MNNSEQEGLKSRRLKTIIVSIIALIVIVFVGIWAISGAISSGKKAATNNKQTETSKTEDKKKEETTTVADPTTATSPSEQYTSTENTQTAPVATETAPATSENIPTTGPTEVIFSALMLGVVAMLATLNIQLAKQNQ